MKKVLIILFIIIVLSICISCTAAGRKELSQMITYKDPQTIGGTWTLTTQNGDKFEHCYCKYWGTNDDTSVWTLENGQTLIQSGACYAIKENKNDI